MKNANLVMILRFLKVFIGFIHNLVSYKIVCRAQKLIRALSHLALCIFGDLFNERNHKR